MCDQRGLTELYLSSTIAANFQSFSIAEDSSSSFKKNTQTYSYPLLPTFFYNLKTPLSVFCTSFFTNVQILRAVNTS